MGIFPHVVRVCKVSGWSHTFVQNFFHVGRDCGIFVSENASQGFFSVSVKLFCECPTLDIAVAEGALNILDAFSVA